jgi:hypothetical protein
MIYENCAEDDKKFYLESFYNKISDFTPKSYFIELTIEEATAIISFYKYNFLRYDNEFTKTDLNNLNKLKSKLETQIKQIKNFNKFFFVRLSNRSPKDGQLFSKQNLKEKFNEELAELKSLETPNIKNLKITDEEFEGNQKLLAYFKIKDKYFIKCESADDAMNLILTSERVYLDLLREIKSFKNVNYKFETRVVLREWVDMNGSMEFRCFVKDNTMLAITQYNHYILVEELLNNDFLLSIRDKIYEYWNSNIKSRLEYLSDYVIDFAVLDSGSLIVVELNPFNKLTGSSMFDWDTDKDMLLNSDTKHINKEDIVIRSKQTPYGNVNDLADVLLQDDLFPIAESLNYLEVIENKFPKKTCLIF